MSRAHSTRVVKLWACALAMSFMVCAGWGPDGHRIIAEIAERYLQPGTRAAIRELLGDESLADASNWADRVRDNPAYDWSKPMHHINVPRPANKVDLSRDCNNDGCVIAAITRYAGVLRDRKAPRDQRIEALKFLVHFVGDVHQPLHVSYADDRGGNQIKVTWFGDSNWNLHAVWDSALIQRDMSNDREVMVARLIDGITNKELREWRSSMNPIVWANESLTITRQLYRDLPADKQLDEAYYDASIATVEARLSAAGVRLAMVLNDILGDSHRSRDEEPAEEQPPAPATQPDSPEREPAVP
jgi:hypothetical protein